MSGGEGAPARDGAGEPRRGGAESREERSGDRETAAGPPSVAVPTPLATPETGSPIRVLHVEDSPEIGELSRTLLTRVDDDFAVETATTAGAALRRLREGGVDCVVSDYLMPHTDGLEFLDLVRERHPALPFVLFTAQGDAAVASRAVVAGATDYMRKRLDHETYSTLAERLKVAVRQAETRQAFWRDVSWFRRQAGPALLGVFVARDGRLVTVTESLAERFGHDPDALRGASPLALVADDDRADVAFLFDRDPPANDPLELAVTAETADGERVPVVLHCGAVTHAGEPALIGVVRAIETA